MEQKDIEAGFIGGLFMRPDRLADLQPHNPEDFSCKEVGDAYFALHRLWSQRQPVNLVTMQQAGVKPQWLADCTDCATIATIPYLSSRIAAWGKRKRIQKGMARIFESVATLECDMILTDLLDLYHQEQTPDRKDPGIKPVVDRFCDYQRENRRRGSLGIDTGFQFFRDVHVQYVPGHVWCMGGYTSVGKTASMVEMIYRLPVEARACIISTEMTEEQMTARMLARATGFHSQVIMSGNMHESNLEREDAAKQELASRNLVIYDDVSELDGIIARLRKNKMRGGLDVAWVDYVQNCRVPGAKSKYEAMEKIATEFQVTAKELRCTIVLLSQVPNAAAKEDSGLLEFKGAGEIAAVCDVGMWLTRGKDNKNLLMWDGRKNRHGQTFRQMLAFQENWTQLEPIKHEHNLPVGDLR